ncbi:MBL fold metallo-hydrolase [Solirubrobacter sp. CPCC 204708]|uniref:MBL fold metallo-hydrolase n=1 Tax=Solirubrobacter deserti TaxID=2282478 RepID=A0ABT4RHL6_9ACTN|nr:MBL fold metallo-hydrolase [Solirubrobacter deserti]MBE2316511.1 MBL fold metallo-hydrolase [Solirubrobacter deserti]MDA0138044.1 MBL fold metallo-hydrolase [Solirubrobacter deserti]
MEITPGVHRIGPLRRGWKLGGYAQCYLIDDGSGELVLVDTGYEHDAHRIVEYLWSIGRTPADIRHIALTHAHRSHLGGVAALKHLNPDLTIHIHQWEADICGGHRMPQPMPFRPLRPLTIYPMRIGSWINYDAHVGCDPDALLADVEGQRIGPLEVVLTQGHTPGSVSFYWRERGVIAVGDAVATWPKLDAGWPGFNLDEPRYRRSLRKLAELQPQVILTGHGPPVTQDAARKLAALV